MNFNRSLLALASLLAFTLFFGLAAAQFPQQGQQGVPQQNFNGQQSPQMQGFGGFGFDSGMGIDQYMSSSAADPQFVAQENLTKAMTNAYTWIASNSSKFAEGCKTEDGRASLTSEIVGAIKQDASTACSGLQSEADSCDSDGKAFCSQISEGKLPIPADARIAMKDAGYDPDTLTLKDMTPDLIQKVCLAKVQKEKDKASQQVDAQKEKLKAQISSFRQECDKLKEFKDSGQGGPMLPTGFGQQYGPGPGQGGPGQPGFGPQGPMQGGTTPCLNGTEPDGKGGCKQSQPYHEGPQINCGPGQHAEVKSDGGLICVPNDQSPQGSAGNTVTGGCQGTPPQCDYGWNCNSGSHQCNSPPPQQQPQQEQQPQVDQQPQQQPEQQPAPEPQPAPTDSGSAPAPSDGGTTASPQSSIGMSPTMFAIMAKLQEADQASGESLGGPVIPNSQPQQAAPPQGQQPPMQGQQPFPQDNGQNMPFGQPQQGFGGFPMPAGPNQGPFQNNGIGQPTQQQPMNQGFGQGGPFNGPFGGPNQQGQGQCPQGEYPDPNNQGNCIRPGNGPQGQGMQGGQGFGGQMGPGGPGPSPEELCGMTDDEIISQFLGGAQGMMGNFPSDAQAQAMCRQNASQVSGGLDRMKLEAAKCQAEAAVSCEAKKEAAKQCNSIDNDPSQTARLVVDNMCRKFGVSTGNGSQSQQDLYKAAANIANADPAAANQLGDTADKTVQDKAKLGLFDKLVGNGDYAQKIKDRADKLKEIRQKLESAGNVDKETLALLDEQIKSLEEESGNFSNLLGIFGRLAS